MGYGLTLVLLIPFLTPAFSQNVSVFEKEKQKLVGLRYGPKNYPKGYENLGGHLIEKGVGFEYVVSHVRRANSQFIWLEKLTHRDSEGKAYFEIRDVLLLPEIKKGEVLVQGACLFGNKTDPEIVAIVKDEKKKMYLNVVIRAWRANCQKEVFEDLNTSDLSCINEGL